MSEDTDNPSEMEVRDRTEACLRQSMTLLQRMAPQKATKVDDEGKTVVGARRCVSQKES